MKLGSAVDLSTQVPIGMVMEVTLREPQRGSVISHRAADEMGGGGGGGGGEDGDGDGSGGSRPSSRGSSSSSRPPSRSGRPSSTTSIMPGMRSKKGPVTTLSHAVSRCLTLPLTLPPAASFCLSLPLAASTSASSPCASVETRTGYSAACRVLRRPLLGENSAS